MTGRVTLQQVASRANVSRATASLVVRGTGRVSDQTRSRVLAAMAELGYVYDRVAAAMRTRQAPVVGVVLSDIANPFFAEVFAGLEWRLRAAGYLPLVVNTGRDLARQDELTQVLLEHQVAALAVAPAAGTASSYPRLPAEQRVPLVLLTLPVEGATASYIGPDDQRGGELAAAHLIEVHGCRTLLVLGGTHRATNRRARLAGVRAAAASAGLPRGAVTERGNLRNDPTAVELGRTVARTLPDGVVCMSDVIAMGLFRAIREAGVRRPVHVTGYDDIPSAAVWEPPLTTVSTHGSDLGSRAATALLRLIADPGQQPIVELVEPELVVRSSCGC